VIPIHSKPNTIPFQKSFCLLVLVAFACLMLKFGVIDLSAQGAATKKPPTTTERLGRATEGMAPCCRLTEKGHVTRA
jgi:hypothetical protein